MITSKIYWQNIPRLGNLYQSSSFSGALLGCEILLTYAKICSESLSANCLLFTVYKNNPVFKEGILQDCASTEVLNLIHFPYEIVEILYGSLMNLGFLDWSERCKSAALYINLAQNLRHSFAIELPYSIQYHCVFTIDRQMPIQHQIRTDPRLYFNCAWVWAQTKICIQWLLFFTCSSFILKPELAYHLHMKYTARENLPIWCLFTNTILYWNALYIDILFVL